MNMSNLLRRHSAPGFTLIELLTVMAVIAVLASLVLMGAGYAQKKAARAKATVEIKGMSAALESYKSDNGIYPSEDATNLLDAQKALNPGSQGYKDASLYLYKQLSGDSKTPDGKIDNDEAELGKTYMEFKKEMLGMNAGGTAVDYISDPFGNSYGYSTAYAFDAAKPGAKTPPTRGYNPTYDLWSTSGENRVLTSGSVQDRWMKNW